jgi:hypothetical protein
MVFKEADIKLPEDFTEDDKDDFKRLYEESKLIHPEVYEKEKWIFYYAIIMYIRNKKGNFEDCLSNEDLVKLTDWSSMENKEIKCEGTELPYLYDKDKNPIFKTDEDLKEYMKNEQGKNNIINN